MTQFGDPEGSFSSIRMTAEPADATAYHTTPQFAVSRAKLVVMSLCTLGLYEIYWAYKQWDAIRRREQESMMPFWRAIFAPLWGFSLFPRLQKLAASHGTDPGFSGSALALAYFIITVAWRLPDPWWLVSFFAWLPLLPVQRAVNELNATLAPEAPRNDSYSGLNILMIVVGGVLLVLAVLGTLMPVPEATQLPTATT